MDDFDKKFFYLPISAYDAALRYHSLPTVPFLYFPTEEEKRRFFTRSWVE